MDIDQLCFCILLILVLVLACIGSDASIGSDAGIGSDADSGGNAERDGKDLHSAGVMEMDVFLKTMFDKRDQRRRSMQRSAAK
ncbi:MAG: hypothetical protein BYD32DRAFT_413480 [Podila humilis]|nr:MAG: hypothetical protein BYD32DRAFT_413480 [Podila humilis]